MFTQDALVVEMNNLKKFALKLTRKECDADDLLQATVLRALEKKHLFETGTNLFSWTSKIMYNIFVSNYRRKVKFETQYDPESYIERERFDASQDTRMEFKEVQEAMNALSECHREILTMVCIKGMQYAEVSGILEIPVGTVRSRLSRARENLQSLLETPRSSYLPLTAQGRYVSSIAA